MAGMQGIVWNNPCHAVERPDPHRLPAIVSAQQGLGARLAVRLRLIYHLGLRFAQGPKHDAISLSEA